MQLAMRSKIPVVPIFIYRQGTTGRHIVRVEPEILVEVDDEISEALLQRNVARMNDVVEVAIRRAPDQWIWSHRRWKTMEEGGGSPYPSRRGVVRRIRKWLRGR